MSADTPASPTVAEAIVDELAARGVRRIFGIPGGGSSLDLIAAAEAAGIDFILSRTEAAAAIMAATTAEIDGNGTPGVVLTGVGPGAASVANGAAQAFLDRAPLLILTDLIDPPGDLPVTHQVFDQEAMFRPVTKTTLRIRPEGVRQDLAAALDLAASEPMGPVHADLSARVAAAPATSIDDETTPGTGERLYRLEDARRLLRAARRPVVISGLMARTADDAAAIRTLAEGLGAPVFTTYKAKGTIADHHPLAAGIFTGGEAEAALVRKADLIILCGVDPVELIPQAWRYDTPILDIGRAADLPHYRPPDATMIGPVAQGISMLEDDLKPSDWTRDEIAADRAAMRTALASPQGAPVTPQVLVERTAAHAPVQGRVAIDAGAHMIPATTFWPAPGPKSVFISNGLATMGFALPAAIAAALQEPNRPATALTGDGGLMMCSSELATAARLNLPVRVIVFNDAALSLIGIKQQAQRRSDDTTRYPDTNFAAIAEAMGCAGFRVETKDALDDALERAYATDGPALVDVAVDPSGYPAQLKALRG